MEEEGGRKGHPLLYLHQSVICKNKTANGSRGHGEETNQHISKLNHTRPSSLRSNSLEKPSHDNDSNVNSKSKFSNEGTFRSQKPSEMKGEEQKAKYHQKSNKSSAAMLFKTIVVTLLTLLLLRLHSILINSNVDIGAPTLITDLSTTATHFGVTALVQGAKKHVLALLPAFPTATDSMAAQFEKRVEVGRYMLRQFDDAAGSVVACESALRSIANHARGSAPREAPYGDVASLAASSMTTMNSDERALMSRALACVGEAKLALFSSSYISPAMKWARLAEAKDSFEAAIAVDPTNPAVRGGLGLAYLLLGSARRDDALDTSLHFVFHSIHHLKGALGLTENTAKRTEGADELAALRAAALHNLGLAYMTLDALEEGAGGARRAHHADWATSLRSSDAAPAAGESWVQLANAGAALLQTGKTQEAVASLEATAVAVCTDSESSSRQLETCLMVQQNLAVAREALFGEPQEPSILTTLRTQAGSRTKIHGQVAQWNIDTASASFSTIGVVSEQSEDMNSSPLDDGVPKTEDNAEEEEESTSANAETKEFVRDTQDAGVVAKSKPKATVEEIRADSEPEKKSDAMFVPPTPVGSHNSKTEMQAVRLAALTALEKEGPHRTRRLLVLARARSSTDDLSGAVEAALKAIDAATSEEESATSTAYLEKLMEKMVGDGMETTMPVPDQRAVERVQETPAFVERNALLQLELELERLKYRVLEQEMMLEQQHNSPKYEGVQVIEYRREADTTDVDNYIITSEAGNMDIEEEAKVDATEEEPPQVEAVEGVEGVEGVEAVEAVEAVKAVEAVEVEPALSKNETHDPSNHLRNESVAENHEAIRADTESLSTVDATDSESHPNNTTATDNESNANATFVTEDVPAVEPVEPIVLPSLYEPTLQPPNEISPTAKSYMRIADAYLDKGKYALAAKQFRKTIKKAPDHLPAHLGYATAVERADKITQKNTAALAYGNATKVAIIQGQRAIAENIMKRAVQIAKSAPSGRFETLQVLGTLAHTSTLAADIHFEIGMEITKQGLEQGDNKEMAIQAFSIANEFVADRKVAENPYHIRSMIELGRIALEYEGNGNKVIEINLKLKSVHMEDDLHVDLLVLVGRAHVSLGELDVAGQKLTQALSFPQCASTPLAHHELAIVLKDSGIPEMKLHFEAALDMGMDPTPEAKEALGERNASMLRALNRQYYQNVNSGSTDTERRGGGGIMSGGGVGSQSASVFAPHAKQSEEAPAQSDTLTLLEQGAATYDGHTPMGGEVEGTESSLSNLKVKKQQGAESNLSNLRL